MADDEKNKDDEKSTQLPLIDYDAGESWAPEALKLHRPFKLAGVEYTRASIQMPTGADVVTHVKGLNPTAELEALAIALTGWSEAVFRKMHAGDRGRILTVVGEFIAGVR